MTDEKSTTSEAQVQLLINKHNLQVDCLVMPNLLEYIKFIVVMDLVSSIGGVSINASGGVQFLQSGAYHVT